MQSSGRLAVSQLRSLPQGWAVARSYLSVPSFTSRDDSEFTLQRHVDHPTSCAIGSTPRSLTNQFASSSSFEWGTSWLHNRGRSCRGYSTDTSHTADAKGAAIVYEGAFSSAHKWLKRASVVNTIVACVASPFVYLYADMGLIGRVGLSVTLAGFGILTTGALHWFTSPYVHELKYDPATDLVQVKGVNLFGRPKWSEFHLSEVTASTDLRPTVLFMARGKGYYVDKENFPDKELLSKLVPKEEPAAPTKGFDDDD